jgi:hypothetical protein
MNPNSFSILGYLSVLLWLAVPVLWLLRGRFNMPCWLALAVAMGAFALAKINSSFHVNRIEIDRSEETVNQLDAAAAKRKAVEEGRAGEVADIRFAEDGADDFIDKAGMEDADRKYLDSIDESKEPAWKGKKKKRGEAAEESDDLEDAISSEEKTEGVKSESLDKEEKREPILMSEPHMMMANRLDGMNIKAAEFAVLLGFIMLLVDYLSRANSYARALYPVPLPAGVLNSLSPLPEVVQRPIPARRSLTEELAWLAKRGDIFICFAKDASDIPSSLPRFGKNMAEIDVIHVDEDRITDEFVFESAWFGRSCFVVDSIDRINQLFAHIYMQLDQRCVARARSKYNVHIVWGIDQALHEDDIAAFGMLARKTGFSLFICNESIS